MIKTAKARSINEMSRITSHAAFPYNRFIVQYANLSKRKKNNTLIR